MKKNKVFLLISIVTILLVGVASVSYAATIYNTPAEIVADLTGKSVDDVVADRQAGTSYGAQAAEADMLDEFQTARLDLYKQQLEEAVADDRLTQVQADASYDSMALKIEACDGTGTGIGGGNGTGVGNGNGLRDGSGAGTGNGTGRGGRGMGGSGLGTGTCIVTDAN